MFSVASFQVRSPIGQGSMYRVMSSVGAQKSALLHVVLEIVGAFYCFSSLLLCLPVMCVPHGVTSP